MKKILPILISIAMVLSAVPVVIGATPPMNPDPETEPCGWDECNEGDYPGEAPNVITQVSVGGSGTSGVDVDPFIKCKWEYDMSVQVDLDDCPDCDIPTGCHDGPTEFWIHDACPCIPGLQVKPDPESMVKVGFYAVVTDPQGRDNVEDYHVWADVWHPDGTYKFQIPLARQGFSGGIYYPQIALDMYMHALYCHEDLVTFNDDPAWLASFSGLTIPPNTPAPWVVGEPWNDQFDVWYELWEPGAYLYYGEAWLSYCQPGGWYHVAYRAQDKMDHWSPWLDNYFWYIPTSGIRLDFDTVDYGLVDESTTTWINGDTLMDIGGPTIKNIGNTPIDLYILQDDMGFGTTTTWVGNPPVQVDEYNVEFDARLSNGGTDTFYDPFEKTLLPTNLQPDPGNPDNPENYYPGVRIGEPDFTKPEGDWLGLCTEEKLDFSIHVKKKADPVDYTGIMNLFACIHGAPGDLTWATEPQFIQNNGPAEP